METKLLQKLLSNSYYIEVAWKRAVVLLGNLPDKQDQFLERMELCRNLVDRWTENGTADEELVVEWSRLFAPLFLDKQEEKSCGLFATPMREVLEAMQDQQEPF